MEIESITDRWTNRLLDAPSGPFRLGHKNWNSFFYETIPMTYVPSAVLNAFLLCIKNIYEHAHEKTSLMAFYNSNVIDLQNYAVWKDDNFTIVWKWKIVAIMLYYNRIRNNSPNYGLLQLSDTDCYVYLKMHNLFIREVFSWARSYIS